MKIFSKKQKDDKFFLIEEQNTDTVTAGENAPEPSHALTPEEVLSSWQDSPKRYNSKGALDALKKRMRESAEHAQGDGKTLLEKCKPYILDEQGKDASVETKPAYTLETVDEILKSDGEKAIEALAAKYDISVDYLGKYVEQKANETKEEQVPTVPKAPKTITEEKEEFEDKIKLTSSVKNVQSSVPFVISEIDSNIPDVTKASPSISDTATITFTPIADSDPSKPKILVTSQTRQLDLTGELARVELPPEDQAAEQVKLEKDDFEDFAPENEVKNETDAKRFIRKFSLSKRKNFLITSFSVILTLALAFMKLPFMSGIILEHTTVLMIVCVSITGIIALLNMEMFLALPKAFSRKSTADVSACIATLTVLAYGIMGIIKGEIVLDLLILLAITLSLRALGCFRKDSLMLSNLKQIAAPTPKNAVKLISDTAVTFAMAKNAIDGETLIAAPQKCKGISDFIKYSTFGTFLSGRLPTITVLSLILSLITGFATATYFDGAVYGLYAAAAIQCFAALPSLFLIDTLPLYAAAKRLNKSGCMIAGKAAAEHIEMANALVINSSYLFPTGTVTLHQMKVLSENNLDETILRAASLTECLQSPLAPIFKRIAGESNIVTLPDSDTVKYEDKMGISGWVDDKLLFIGNRTLMEAHGILVPDIEVDRKILRNGYFPVYLASGDKVCALLIVQYDVDPAVTRELRRLTKIGVTLLVNNTDPNITNEMLCDYLGLYDDSVMIMSTAGCHMYKNAVTYTEKCSAPAAFKGGQLALAKIMNCANRIRRSNTLLTVLYVISAILGIIIFAYTSFNGSGSLISGTTVLLYSLICTAISYLLYLVQKP